MNLFRVIFPTILIIYFIWYAKNRSIYLLGVPLLYYMSSSVIFSYHFMGIFNKPGRIDSDFRLFVLLVFAWLVITNKKRFRRSQDGKRCYRPENIYLMIFAAITVIYIIIALVHNVNMIIIYYDASKIIYMIMGYYIIKQIMITNTWIDIKNFTAIILIIVSASTLMFIAHQGMSIQIYPYEEYSEFTFMGSSLTRTFSIMNPLLLFLVAYALATTAERKVSTIMLLIGMTAILISYTRSFILAMVMMLIISLMQSRKFFKKILTLILPLVLMLWIARSVFPMQTGYAMFRMQEVSNAFTGYTDKGISNISNVSNVEVRQVQFADLYNSATTTQKVFGYGYRQSERPNEYLTTGIYDSSWQGIFVYFGIIGIVLFGMMQLHFLILATKLASSTIPGKALTGRISVLIICGSFVQSFAGMVLLPPHGAPFALWVYAVVSSETQRKIYD